MERYPNRARRVKEQFDAEILCHCFFDILSSKYALVQQKTAMIKGNRITV